LDTTPDSLDMDYIGMHHYGWAVGVRRNGREALPEALAAAAQIAPEVEPAITQAIGAIPGPYHNYFFHPDRMLAKKAGKRTRAEELLELQDEILEDYARARATGARRRVGDARRAMMPSSRVLLAFAGRRQWRPDAFHPERRESPYCARLPPEAIVETPVLVQHGRARALAAWDAPPEVKAWVQGNCAYEMLAVEAIVERDRVKAARALLLNPMGITYDQAVTIVERAWAHG
jgi:6-phospho-beta-glucosidase